MAVVAGEQLSLLEGRRRRDRGIERVTKRNRAWLEVARSVAHRLAHRHGTVTADDVREYLEGIKLVPSHPNTWGAVFRCPEFVPTGEYRQSRTPSRHAAIVRVWRSC